MSDTERKLGRYELRRRLATGGMGEIYLARTRGAGGFEKSVIIKTILPHLAEEEEFVTKFLDEGRIVVQLTHGNIVPVFDMGEEDGEYFIAMEYVPGLDLRAILKRLAGRNEQLPVELALYVACEVCKGLGYAHRKVDADGNPLHIVHRDVSPSNVLISREGEVKIIDFGIARAAGKVAKTASGRIQGKCCYMSPEQARGQPLDARSDIFSTGVLLYEMLTLTRPFEGRTDLESLELVRQCETDPPGVLRPAIPDEVDEIVSRAMAPQPEDRYESIDDLFVDLQHEIYRLGHTVTSQRLVGALSDVFADEAAADATTKTPRKPANVDEALELELARLGEEPATPSHPSSGPLGYAVTAASADGGHTRTMSTTPPRPMPSAADNESGVNGNDASPVSHTPITHPQGGEQQPTTGETHPTTGADAQGLSTSPAVTPEEHVRLSQLRQRRFTVIGTLLVGAGIIFAIFALRPTHPGVLTLASEPEGAQIHLDGEQLIGQRTPERLELEPGNYLVELTLEDHHPWPVRVKIEAGEEVILDEDDIQLRPAVEPPREFVVTTEPESATLLADGEDLGTSPHTIELRPDEVINLSTRAPDCTTTFYTLSYGHQRDEIHFDLQCDPTDEEQDEQDELRAEARRHPDEAVPPQNTPGPARYSTIRIDTVPDGAEIVVDDSTVGTAPVSVELHRQRRTTVEAHLDGFESYATTTTASEINGDRLEIQLVERPRGCLDFRAVYPAHNKIAINGEWLDGRHMALQNHSLVAGTNTITVRHPESEREESFEVEIEAGSNCKVLTVWEPD